MTRRPLLAALLTAALLAAPAAARADRTPSVRVLSRDVVAPFGLHVARGALYVADGGTNTASRFDRGRLVTVAAGAPGGELAGVAVNRRGDVATAGSVSDAVGVRAATLTVKRAGRAPLVVDLLAHEREHNPDGQVSYGVDRPTPCQAETFDRMGGAQYRGLVDSHPYAVAPFGDGWVVADAGANALLRVSAQGRVSTLAVLPRQPVTITADAAASLGLAGCAIGAVYNAEPVPTGVDPVGQRLLVSLLPGGPENPSLGARGSVQLVDARTGRARQLAGGLAGATGVALGPRGRVYVAELFAGRVSVLERGRARPFVQLPGVVSLAHGGDALYAGTLGPQDAAGDPAGHGTLVAIATR